MVTAAALYLAINAGGDGAVGWGAAVSTDTALALGALSLLTRGRAIRLRVFLLTVVVIDDLAALLVIALGYSEDVTVMALAVAIGLFGVLLALRWAGSWRGPAAVLVGIGIWFAMFESGVDAVIAGLAIGLITSAYPPARDQLERSTELTRSFREQPTPELAYSARASLISAISPNERLQYRLHPWTSRVIVPLFALANAGIHLDGDLLSRALTSPVTLGHHRRLRDRQAGRHPRRDLAGDAHGARRRPADRHVAGAHRRGARRPASASPSRCWSPRSPSPARCSTRPSSACSRPRSSRPRWRGSRSGSCSCCPPMLRARQLGNTAETIVDLDDDVDPERDHIRGRARRAGHAARVRRLRVPVLRPRGADRSRGCSSTSATTLRYVFRHLPLTDVHPNAQIAAEAAEAAAAQGKFWEMHDRLLTHQDALAPGGPLPPRRGARARPRPLLGRPAPAPPRAAGRRGRRAAPTPAASRARRRSSSTAAATSASTTSTRSPAR